MYKNVGTDVPAREPVSPGWHQRDKDVGASYSSWMANAIANVLACVWTQGKGRERSETVSETWSWCGLGLC